MTEVANLDKDPARNPEGLREVDRPIASVVIVSGDGKILMGLKDPKKGGVYPDVWHIPGGGIDEGETLEDAARREGREETGIDLSGVELKSLPTGSGETTKTLESGERIWVRMRFNRFEARLSKPAAEIELRPGDDLVKLRWFESDELANAEQVPGGREFFVEAGYIQPDSSL